MKSVGGILATDLCFNQTCKGDFRDIGCIVICYASIQPTQLNIEQTQKCYTDCKEKTNLLEEYASCVNKCIITHSMGDLGKNLSKNFIENTAGNNSTSLIPPENSTIEQITPNKSDDVSNSPLGMFDTFKPVFFDFPPTKTLTSTSTVVKPEGLVQEPPVLTSSDSTDKSVPTSTSTTDPNAQNRIESIPFSTITADPNAQNRIESIPFSTITADPNAQNIIESIPLSTSMTDPNAQNRIESITPQNTSVDANSILQQNKEEIVPNTTVDVNSTLQQNKEEIVPNTTVDVNSTLQQNKEEIVPNTTVDVNSTLQQNKEEIVPNTTVDVNSTLQQNKEEIVPNTTVDVNSTLQQNKEEIVPNTTVDVNSTLQQNKEEIVPNLFGVSTISQENDLSINKEINLPTAEAPKRTETTNISDSKNSNFGMPNTETSSATIPVATPGQTDSSQVSDVLINQTGSSAAGNGSKMAESTITSEVPNATNSITPNTLTETSTIAAVTQGTNSESLVLPNKVKLFEDNKVPDSGLAAPTLISSLGVQQSIDSTRELISGNGSSSSGIDSNVAPALGTITTFTSSTMLGASLSNIESMSNTEFGNSDAAVSSTLGISTDTTGNILPTPWTSTDTTNNVLPGTLASTGSTSGLLSTTWTSTDTTSGILSTTWTSTDTTSGLLSTTWTSTDSEETTNTTAEANLLKENSFASTKSVYKYKNLSDKSVSSSSNYYYKSKYANSSDYMDSIDSKAQRKSIPLETFVTLMSFLVVTTLLV
ncbi:hypothetical protein BB561_004938 [Smittium simulii]|uniref:Uncharacterized protein n=1 Tax=Smittium simulii TaxID=133385 RepID=A0A2T9YD63_9FUNG|nr:hypothetical protein BB561_004938 [Smittium simulii]